MTLAHQGIEFPLTTSWMGLSWIIHKPILAHGIQALPTTAAVSFLAINYSCPVPGTGKRLDWEETSQDGVTSEDIGTAGFLAIWKFPMALSFGHIIWTPYTAYLSDVLQNSNSAWNSFKYLWPFIPFWPDNASEKQIGAVHPNDCTAPNQYLNQCKENSLKRL